MKKLLFLLSAAAIGFGCSEDECAPVLGVDSGGNIDEIKVTAAIADIEPLLKTTITGSTAVWANNDSLGLFCPQSKLSATINMKFTFDGIQSKWTPGSNLYWKDGATLHKFVAYAPYAAGNTDSTAVKLPALSVQTGTIDPTKDFLISNNLKNGIIRTASVGLVFTHALSLIEFQIKTDANSIAASSTLTSYTLTAGASEKMASSDATSSTINLTTAAIVKGTTSNVITVTPGTAPTLSATPISSYALLLPGTYTAPSLAITISEAGTTPIVIPAVSIVTTTFDPGKKYTYVVTISRTAITISTPTITDWTTVNGAEIKPGI